MAQRQPNVTIKSGQLVSATPDSIYKAQADVSIGDSLEVSSIHIVVLDSTVSVFDNQFVISSLPVVFSASAWKEGETIHIDVPNINPFKTKRYFVEFLSSSGQLLLQIEKEF